MNGFLVVNKPEGFTSYDVVAKLKRLFGTKKIGHAGTLDPAATGVLPVFVGNATRAIPLLDDDDKEYDCRMRLGVATDTEDLTGTVLEERPVHVTEEEVRTAVASFVGEYDQIPPMYSAKKVDGRKLCDLARSGLTVELKAEKRRIESLTVREIDLPEAAFSVTVSKGTYVRSLCRDIGLKLGTLGTMVFLRRTRHGRFTLAEAKNLEEIEKAFRLGKAESLLAPTEMLFQEYPVLTVPETLDRALQNGNVLPREIAPGPLSAATFRIRHSTGEFRGLYRFSPENGTFMPVRIFPS